MNNSRRARIAKLDEELTEVSNKIEALATDEQTREADPNLEGHVAFWKDTVSNLCDDAEEILGEEEEYRDNVPENLQSSERYSTSESACEHLSEAHDLLDNLRNQEVEDFCRVWHESYDDITSALNQAKE